MRLREVGGVLIGVALTALILTSPASGWRSAALWSTSVVAVRTDDGEGHGPDPGTREWRGILEARLRERADRLRLLAAGASVAAVLLLCARKRQ